MTDVHLIPHLIDPQVIAEKSRKWIPPSSLEIAFLFGKNVYQLTVGYISPSRNNMQLKRPHSIIPHGCLTILTCLSTCHLREFIILAYSSNLPRDGAGNLVPIYKPFDTFKWGLLNIVKQTIGEINIDPRFH